MAEGFEVINLPPAEVPLEMVDGLKTVDYTYYEPLEFTEVFQGAKPGMLEGLQVLKLFSNYLKSIPESFKKLTSLQELVLYCNRSKMENGLQSLPSYFGELGQLRLLNLDGNQFGTFPECICDLRNLKTLYMNNCNLKYIPETVRNLTSLVVVDFSDNDFSSQGLPKGLFLLKQLKDLYLAKCKLQALPPDVEGLENLQGIRVGQNELSEFPDEFYNLRKLKKLYAEWNHLKVLSPKVAQLQCLQFLFLMHNELTTLPEEISQLKELVHLNMFDNLLTCIPRSITEMQKLCYLQLEGNSYLQRPPLGVCLGGLDRIKGYFDSFGASDIDPIHSRHLTLVLFGESEAGKSCLAHALLHASARPPSSADESTVGVQMYTWLSPDGIEFKIIDCAGQRRYQLTHPFFLSEGALHLVVVNLYKYEQTDTSFKENIGDWLDMISYRISKPRIMIVPTYLDKFGSSEKQCVTDKCNHILKQVKNYEERQAQLLKYEIKQFQKREAFQQKKEELDNLQWQENNRPVISSVLNHCDGNNAAAEVERSYIAMVPVSNKRELTGMIQLQQEITRVAQDQDLFPSVGRDLPPSWVKLEKALKKHRNSGGAHYMSYEDFEAFALEHSQLQGPTLGSAVQYFDVIGELKYYKDIPSLHINVFLDLEWLAKLMKLLFRHDHRTSLCYKIEYLGLDGLDEQSFQDLSENLENDGLLSIKLLRCIWMDMELGEMFNGMVSLLQHLGLACKVPSVDEDKMQILVPWFLDKVSGIQECWPDRPPSDQVEVNLMISTLSYLPPALFDRLRVKACNLALEQHNWDEGMLIRLDNGLVRVQCVDEQKSPAIMFSGRSPRENLDKLWELLLRIVQEAHILLKEWRRLAVRSYSMCPSCVQCRFECNWLRTNKLDIRELQRKVQRCKKNRGVMAGNSIDMSLICPTGDVVDRVLGLVSQQSPVTEGVSDQLFVTLAPDMANCWRTVAGHLGINATTVDRIRADSSNVTDCAMAMLTLWHTNNLSGATKAKLMKAFQEVGRMDLAEKVRRF